MDTKVMDIFGVPTNIFTWGKSFDKKEIVLVITGNPGISAFYFTFLSTLFKLLQGNIPICVIGEVNCVQN